MIRILKAVAVIILVILVFKWLYQPSNGDLVDQYRDLFPALQKEDVATVQCVVDKSWNDNPNIKELVESGKSSGLSFDLPRYLEECQ